MSIMPLSEFSGEKNESRENRVMRWRERYYRQESCIATLKAQRDELLAAANRYEFRELQLVEALKAYIDKYGPGYSCTDRLAYDNAIGVLAAIDNAEKGKPEC